MTDAPERIWTQAQPAPSKAFCSYADKPEPITGFIEYVRADLSPAAVTVNPLPFREYNLTGNHVDGYECRLRALTSNGNYFIDRRLSDGRFVVRLAVFGSEHSVSDTVEQAVKSANDENERRLLSGINVTPVPVAPAAVTVKQIEDELKDYKQLDELFCCSGFDVYGQVRCGCQGVTLREEIARRIVSLLSALGEQPDAVQKAARVLVDRQSLADALRAQCYWDQTGCVEDEEFNWAVDDILSQIKVTPAPVAEPDQPGHRFRKWLLQQPSTAGEAVSEPDAVQELVRLLKRYRNETPLGHQPHMIAEEVDTALRALSGQDTSGRMGDD